MNRFARKRLVSALAVAASLLMTSLIACRQQHAMTEEEIRSNLRVGMDNAEVEKFFTDHGIEHSLIPSEELKEEEHLSRDPATLGGKYVAIIRDTKRRQSVSESITISVEIDHAGRVVHVDVGRVATGI